jgi:hypothetical protein
MKGEKKPFDKYEEELKIWDSIDVSKVESDFSVEDLLNEQNSLLDTIVEEEDILKRRELAKTLKKLKLSPEAIREGVRVE